MGPSRLVQEEGEGSPSPGPGPAQVQPVALAQLISCEGPAASSVHVSPASPLPACAGLDRRTWPLAPSHSFLLTWVTVPMGTWPPCSAPTPI